ncbi:MAG TPA: hypothetical protein ENK21_05515, partial [Trueperaceae bacterium]|nr:hypothetical protein [Trueperaceae bacterium]
MKNLKIGLLIIATTFWLLAGSNCGESPPPVAKAPVTPSGLSATAANGAVSLSWAANTEANLKGYNVYWGKQSNSLGQSKFVDKSQTSTTISGLENKTEYYFAIDAENDEAKVSAKSSTISATPINTSFTPGDTESYAPGRRGEIKTFTIKGRKITYEVIDGLAIYQGDMILGKAANVDKTLRELSNGISTQGITCDGSDYVFFFSLCNKWSNGIVKYSIKDDWGSDENNREMRLRIANAMSHWQQKTNLRFVASDSGDRLEFQNSEGCSSKIGRIGSAFTDTQSVNLNMGCSTGNIIHEIGHAIGIFHEQSREDRDRFVQINNINIQADKESNFDKYNSEAKDMGSYDFDSIMHYGCWAFSTSDERTAATRTIVPLGGRNCNNIGQRSSLSEGDILSAYSLYLPDFSFSGAAAGSSIARNTAFNLSLNFDIEAVKNEYIIWTRSGASGTIATGRTARFVPLSWPVGEQTITASIVIKGVTLLSKSISF